MSFKINNTFEEWCRLKEDVEQKVSDNNLLEHVDIVRLNDDMEQEMEQKVFKIDVKVSCLPDEESHDVTLLLYAFPIFDIVRESAKVQGILNICIEDKYFVYNKSKHNNPKDDVPSDTNKDTNKVDEELFHSLKAQLLHYLYLQLYFRQSLRITINNEPLNPVSTRFGKISPLMSFTNRPQTTFFYKGIYNIITVPGILSSLKGFLLKYRENPEYDSITKSGEYEEILKYTKYINMNFEKESKNRYPNSKNLSLETMWSLPYQSKGYLVPKNEDIRVEDIYFRLFLSNISYIVSRSIKGKNSNKVTEEEKLNLIDELLDFVEQSCWNVPVFAQYLWSILMRYTFTNGRIIGGIAKKRYLIQEFMEKTLQNAISYAESLYQIIENSCFHTSTGNAYFSVRVYETDRGVGFEDSIKANQTLLKLSENFTNYKFDEQDTKLYLNFILIDNSYDSTINKNVGMIDHYNAKRDLSEKVSSIKELFNLMPKTEEDLSVHYGLRVLKKIICVNEGCFKVSTADKKEIYYVVNNSEGEENDNLVYSGTRYDILLPINEQTTKQVEQVDSDVSEWLDARNILNENIVPLRIQLSVNSTMPKNQKEKDEYVRDLHGQIERGVGKCKKEDKIICLYLQGSEHYKIELWAKAIMKYTIRTKTECNRLALLFDDKKYIYEFIRIYSVFFDKSGQNYELFKLRDTQIALCSMRDNIPEVNMVLSGNNLSVVRHTLKMYAYYNAESSLEFIPTISYITKTENEQLHKVMPIFPFDIYLDINSFNEPYTVDARGIIEDNTWFFKRIFQVLNTDMRSSNYGCKIDDIHVSIGSKIHIDSFYNAELLFHNCGNVSRFAYIVAREILREYRLERKRIRLISYESYSALFVQKVCDIIKGYDENYDVDFLIYLANSERMESEQNEYFWKDVEKHANEYNAATVWHVILPIGTTLSTICKIQDATGIISKHINSQCHLNFGKSITLILVGGVENNQGVEMGYWKELDEIHKKIVLQKYQPLNSEKLVEDISNKVRYYFNVKCLWWDAKEKPSDDSIQRTIKKSEKVCLVGVDKTSTIPDVIFEQFNNPKKLFEDRNCSAETRKKEKSNDKRIRLINEFNCVRYSHLYNSGNHFQYDIDYYKLCRKTKTQDEIIKWLKSIRNRIDTDAFNIIVSPLDTKNSIFLKLVTEVGFESCSRLLHVNINESYRENVRSKFGYIRKELEQINKMSRNTKVNVYYVDDCIVSGHTLHRGSGFIRMLLAQECSNTNNVCVYKGIFVLANRSSYDTIQEVLPGRVETDFHYFMRLNVPLYNTYNGQCPGCELAQQYGLMHKRSSTHVIASEYNRLRKKHSLKTSDEYETYIEKEILNKTSYLIWFKQWMYFLPKAANKYDVLLKVYQYICSNKGDYRSLNDVFLVMQSSVNKRDFVDNFKEYIIGERSYRRMYCTHEILTALDGVMEKSDNEADAEAKTRNCILTVISKRFEEIDREPNSEFYKMRQKAEWLISYIKVISRNQIAKYYHIRSTIYNVLSELTQALMGEEGYNEDIEILVNLCDVRPENRFENSITPEMKFNLFFTLIRRLADLHSPLIIRKQRKIYEFYNKCYNQYNAKDEYSSFYLSNGDNPEEYKRLIPFMSESDFDFQIAKLTKWSAMSGYDGSYCFEIEDAFLRKNEDDINSRFCKNLAYLENTYIIYMGIKNIVETVAGYDRKFAFQTEDILQIRRIIDEKNTVSKIYPHKIFFDFMSLFEAKQNKAQVVYNEKYKDMCLLFSELRHIEANASVVDSPYPYERLCNYFCSITGYDQCIIAYKEDRYAKVLVSSDINSKYLFKDLTPEMLSAAIRKFDERAKEEKTDDIVQKFHLIKKQETEILIIKIPILEANKTNAYILMYKNDIVDSELEHKLLTLEDCWNIRNILFLRDKIEMVLSRDMTSLISMISSYDYVEQLNEHEPVILHISDLHISTSNADGMIKAIKENCNNVAKPENALINIKPDLILITGDIVQASYSAPSLLNNYKAAEKVIKELARVAWGFTGREKGRSEKLEKVEFIRTDWKKRVLISTGNHDYASMNELEAQNKARKTTAGIPGENVGSTMIKYSYFIDFLHRLLGLNFDRAIKYDLNDIVQYRKLRLTVFNINSGSGVNPYRTNKVKINDEALRRLMSTEKERYRSIHMMHHTPIYNIDYISDIYYINEDVLRRAYDLAGGVLSLPSEINISDSWIKLIESVLENSSKVINGIDANVQENLLKIMISAIKDIDVHAYIEKNLSDLKYYLSTEPKERIIDDRCSQFLTTLRERKNMSDNDNRSYAESVVEYCKDLEEDFYILGGHEHTERKYEGEYSGALNKCRGIFEAGKFFDEHEPLELHYSYLKFGDKYEFVNGPSEFQNVESQVVKYILEGRNNTSSGHIDESKDMK